VYREYYDAKTSHRRLQWTYSLGQCNVKGTFGGKKVFELQVTTLQAIVMLAFNKDKVLFPYFVSPRLHVLGLRLPLRFQP
jgi:cullin 1